MNNEPVVWTACLDCGKRVTGDSIHTCSPQLKTLTDEEILEIANQCLVGATAWHNPDLEPIDFARAILRKAQEK
jgi:hypothetical protein